MNTNLLPIIAIAVLSAIPLNGAIVLSTSHPNLDGITTPDVFIVDLNDNKLASGFAGLGGFTTLSRTQVEAFASTSDFAPLVADFVSFIGSDNFVAGMRFQNGAASPGAFAIQNTLLDPTAFIGQDLYTFVGDGATLLLSNAFVLFKHAEVLIADPLPPATPNDLGLDLADGTLLIGTRTSIETTDSPLLINTLTDVSAIRLAGVPEPSYTLISVLGLTTILRRKR